MIARTCELPRDARCAVSPCARAGRPALLAYPWFMLAGSLVLARRRRGVVQSTGAIVLNRVDVHRGPLLPPGRPGEPEPLDRRCFACTPRSSGGCCAWPSASAFGANRSATFVGVSEGVAEEVREHYPQLAERVLSIHNGVDTAALRAGSARCSEARALRERLGIADGSPRRGVRRQRVGAQGPRAVDPRARLGARLGPRRRRRRRARALPAARRLARRRRRGSLAGRHRRRAARLLTRRRVRASLQL